MRARGDGRKSSVSPLYRHGDEWKNPYSAPLLETRGRAEKFCLPFTDTGTGGKILSPLHRHGDGRKNSVFPLHRHGDGRKSSVCPLQRKGTNWAILLSLTDEESRSLRPRTETGGKIPILSHSCKQGDGRKKFCPCNKEHESASPVYPTEAPAVKIAFAGGMSALTCPRAQGAEARHGSRLFRVFQGGPRTCPPPLPRAHIRGYSWKCSRRPLQRAP